MSSTATANDTGYRELFDSDGKVRPQWQGLHSALEAMGPEALAERAARLERAFAEEGISGLLPSAEPGYWRFDPVPYILPRDEFLALERGLGQRARLLEAVLQDVYGPQKLLEEGLLPPPLIYSNPGFLRACRRTDGPLPRQIHFYAADLVRTPDGKWQVLTDHVDGTTGIARVMENRRMMARVLPELFPPMQIAQLRPFFDMWAEQLQRLAPAGEGPGVAVLTSGHHDQSWFEHVLISRELSCALVESPDLTVRDGSLFLKTMRGLQRINVLLRRVSGDRVDPLEIPNATGEGVPGLLDAVRGANLLCVNYPGTAVMKSAGIASYLPRLAQHLLGEKLELPCVPTRWMGDPEARAEVLANPEQWDIAPAFRDLDMKAHPCPENTPHLYAGIDTHPPSTAPCAGPAGLECRSVGLRLYLLHDENGQWRAMPGGLAQVLPEGAHRLQRHNMAKDVWVEVDPTDMEMRASTPYVVQTLTIRRAGSDLPSRVADDFFWFGRYLERVEAAARLHRAANSRLSRATPLPREWSELQILMACLAHFGVTDPDQADHLASKDAGLTDYLNKVSTLTEKLRDRLTGDMYAAVTLSLRELKLTLGADGGLEEGHGAGLDQLQHALTSVLHFTATVSGLAAENMVRSGGHLFLDLGRRLERAQGVAGLLSVALDRTGGQGNMPPKQVEAGLRVALELCDSAITYRSRYLTVMQPAPVLDLVLADAANPRSLAFQLQAARSLLAEIENDPEAPLARRMGVLLAQMDEIVSTVLTASDQIAAASKMAMELRRIESEIATLSQDIVRCYFTLLPATQVMGDESTELSGARMASPSE